MKKLLFVLMIISELVYSQCPTSITLTTQNEINTFPATYPGCNVINGNLFIDDGSASNINFLDSLYVIDSVFGDFKVKNCWNLDNLEGLENLQSVSGKFEINKTSKLQNLNDLSSITSIGGEIYIYDNSRLKSLSGLNNISEASRISIFLNDSLSDLNALSNIDSTGNITLYSNPLVKNLSAFSNLLKCQNFIVNAMHGLKDLTGIGRLVEVNDFEVAACDSLLSLNGADSLKRIALDLDINTNAQLTTLGFPLLIFVGDELFVKNNNELQNLNGLTSLDTVVDKIWIEDNLADSIDLNGVSVKHCGSLFIRNNTGVYDLGFNNLDSISTSFEIADNVFKDSIQGFSSLRISPEIYIADNSGFIDLNICNNLRRTDWFVMSINSDLVSVNGFNSLESINQKFAIEYSSDLESIAGLSNLKDISGEFKLLTNRKLNSIDNLNSVSNQSLTNLSISFVDSLDFCGIGFICDYLNESTNTYTLSSNNGTGCQTRDDILASCLTTNVNARNQEEILIYPNPSSDDVFIELMKNSTTISARILDLQGREVLGADRLTSTENVIKLDVSDLSPGTYLLNINSGDQVQVKKISVIK